MDIQHWSSKSIFYHIYPLGNCGAPQRNDFSSAPVPRIEHISHWIQHFLYLGINTLYLGPVFESSAHGYDTADYFRIDRRLGTNDDFSRLIKELHSNGIRVILDGVFHHVGRDFWAFRDVQLNKQNSRYCEWFSNINFTNNSPFNDCFSYDGWNGHYDLVKLNLKCPEVREHLLHAVEYWIQNFEIDGLRLDVANQVDPDFLKELSTFTKAIHPDFWLLGEVIHGNYRQWVNSESLDSVTNYECYKGLYSSFVDKNFFEIAWSLNRQFGRHGLYNDLQLYNFVDNHDVSRIASLLPSNVHLFTIYSLLFTMPGIPSVYCGSEFGLPGKIENGKDAVVRQFFNLHDLINDSPVNSLPVWIAKLAKIRANSDALTRGDYVQLLVNSEWLAFSRESVSEYCIVIINATDSTQTFSLDSRFQGSYLDLVTENHYSTEGRCLNVNLAANSTGIYMYMK
ncbi:MAG: alpha-amylase [Ignavibacteria bacterium]|nr:alpha-amylase [Ignavibacteria bacterium]